jgi:hypothetical protein
MCVRVGVGRLGSTVDHLLPAPEKPVSATQLLSQDTLYSLGVLEKKQSNEGIFIYLFLP